jgi:hypothetical protein
LVLVDRYSGWPSVHQVKVGGTSKELVKVLQGHCETFGVMEELMSVGGPQFVSARTQASSIGSARRTAPTATPGLR